jgi:4-amino-4-deoxy-L-arabinose transferase-like glycosyltransferase
MGVGFGAEPAMRGPNARVIVSSSAPGMRTPAQSRLVVIVLVVVACCIVVRGTVALTVLDTDPHVVMQADSSSYLKPALALLEDGRFTEAAGDPHPEFLRTPGYPAFIALVYFLAGHRVVALLLAQVMVGAATVLVAFFLGRRSASSTVGIVAAALLVLEPLQLYTTGTILTEALATLCLTLVALLGFVVVGTPRPALRWPFLLGLTLAVATLVRPVTYYLPALVVAFLIVAALRRRTPWRDAATVLAAFLVPLVVLVGGWQLRNDETVGSWRFSGIEAKNLYLYRAAEIVATDQHTHLGVAQRELLDQLGNRGKTSQGPYYARMYRRGLAIVEGHPVTATEDALAGLVDEITSARSRFFAYVGLPDPPALLGDLAIALLMALYTLAALGIIAAVRARKNLMGHAFVLAVAAYVLVASAGPEAAAGRGERFRAVIMPLVVVYAARGAVEGIARARTVVHAHRTRPSLPRRSLPSAR